MNRLVEALKVRVPFHDMVDDLTTWEIDVLADELAPKLNRLLDERLQDRVDRAGSRIFDRD